MLKTQRDFLDNFFRQLTMLRQLIEQANAVYGQENDTHNHLKQVYGHPAPREREDAFLEGRQRDRAEAEWLWERAQKLNLERSIAPLLTDVRENALEASRMIEAGAGADFLDEAKMYVVIASDLMFKALHARHLMHIEKPRVEVDVVFKNRYTRSVHELKVTSLACPHCDH